VDVRRLEGPRRRGRQQAIDQLGEAVDFGFDERDQFGRGGVVGHAAFEQLRGAFQSRQRIAQFVREPLQRGGQRARQQLRGVVAGEFLDRMRFEPPTATVARGEAHVREPGRIRAGKGQRDAAQARALPGIGRHRAGETRPLRIPAPRAARLPGASC
jgi:hypothetical protein